MGQHPGLDQITPPGSAASDGSKAKQPKSARYIQEFNKHEPHPDCPDTLACLPDTDGRPQHTLPVILRCAILGSPRRRLTIREIYAAMEDKYSYYKTAGPTWKQSVRHHLSLNRLFERQTRPVTDPGFGSYWTVNLEAPPGTKRPRKRGRPSKDGENEASPAPPKKRGRPKKNVEAAPSYPESPSIATLHPPERSLSRCQVSSVRTSREEDDEEMMTPEDSEGSEDEYESEDVMVPPNHRSSMAGLNAFGMQPPPPSSTRSTHMSSFNGYENPSLEALHSEITGLRRQASEAVSVSLRLSDQLADAQAETSRCKSSLRTAEGMLEDESRRRKEAERIADEEGRLRRAAEDALRLLRMQWPNSSRPPA
ncbi:hypothetical protein HWV62_20938 [Athelia sp. TMB]|nr:hypothetical protein HWV62_20938 [Athelia sp. TMB]